MENENSVNEQYEMMQTEIEKLRLELAQAKASAPKSGCRKIGADNMSAKVAQSGGVSVYGLGRWPVTLYKRQWLRLLAAAPEVLAFIRDNDQLLPDK